MRAYLTKPIGILFDINCLSSKEILHSIFVNIFSTRLSVHAKRVRSLRYYFSIAHRDHKFPTQPTKLIKFTRVSGLTALLHRHNFIRKWDEIKHVN